MFKNVAGQTISGHLINKTDGSDVTEGSCTVYVTIDDGSQAQGTVGSGAATHKGNGEWQYAPSQAETNGDRITFLFKHASGVTDMVQVFTRPVTPSVNVEQWKGSTAPNMTGDAYARLGEPDGASIAADIAALNALIDDVLSDTGTTIPALLLALEEYVDDEIAAIKSKTDNLPSDPADQSQVEAAISAAQSTILGKLLAYVQLMTRKDAAIATDRATELSEINANQGSGGGAYANTTDAQEAIRDRGDAAWTGGEGGGGGSSDWTADERAALRTILGIPSSGSTPETPSAGVLADLKSGLAGVKAVTDNLPDGGALSSVASAAGLEAIEEKVDAVLEDTGSTGVVVAEGSKTGYSLSSSGVQAIWDALTSALTTAGSIGKLLVDRIDAAISSRSTYAGADTPGTTTLLSRLSADRAGYLDNLDGHVPQSGDAYAVLTDGSHGNAALLALLQSIYGFLDTEIAEILEDTGMTLNDLVDDLEDRLTAGVATALQAHAPALGRLVVGQGSTTTEVVFDTVNGAAASSVDDHYNGRVIVFTSGVLALQAVKIEDYDGATKTATISAATSAPATGVTAIIV